MTRGLVGLVAVAIEVTAGFVPTDLQLRVTEADVNGVFKIVPEF